jgi:hypothetical protein
MRRGELNLLSGNDLSSAEDPYGAEHGGSAQINTTNGSLSER